MDSLTLSKSNLGDYRPKPKYPGLEYRVMGIGMYHHFKVINEGLKFIQSSIDRGIVDKLKDAFFLPMKEVDDKIKIINKLKVEKLYDDILRLWNSEEGVLQSQTS